MLRLSIASQTGALIVALLVTSAVQAQPGRGSSASSPRGRQGTDQLSLLRNEQIQKELKVTDEQKEKVNEIYTAQREKLRSEISTSNIRDASQEERAKLIEKYREQRAKLAKENEKSLAEVLTEDQSKRLGQIQVQLLGIRALNEKEVQKKLELSEEQAKEIATTYSSLGTARIELFRKAREIGNTDSLREQMEELAKKREKSMMSVLDEKQKKAFAELKGKPFELQRQSRGTGRGRPTGRPADSENTGRPKRPAKAE
jgi:Spy/CpxP family protein refolding chaperone